MSADQAPNRRERKKLETRQALERVEFVAGRTGLSANLITPTMDRP